MERGQFISFEGSEGCGKSTQIQFLTEFLKESGCTVLVTREPGGTAVGERIRELLQFTPEADGMSDQSELLLFAASRSQLVREVIRPALEKGTWVIADRFLDSTTVYQGVGRGLDPAAVEQINQFAIGDTKPDWTILLDMDAEHGHARAIKARGETSKDRIEDQPLAFFEKVRAGYLELAAAEPERIAVFDAAQSREHLSDDIRKACQARFEHLTAKQ